MSMSTGNFTFTFTNVGFTQTGVMMAPASIEDAPVMASKSAIAAAVRKIARENWGPGWEDDRYGRAVKEAFDTLGIEFGTPVPEFEWPTAPGSVFSYQLRGEERVHYYMLKPNNRWTRIAEGPHGGNDVVPRLFLSGGRTDDYETSVFSQPSEECIYKVIVS